jgi:hypothetical protein
MQQTSFRSDQVFFPFLVVEELYPPTSGRRRKVFKLRYTLAGPDIEVEKIKVDLLFWHWTLKLNPKYDIYLETRCQFRQHFTCALLVQKCFAQLFSSYVLALGKVQKRFRTKNEHVKC